MIRTFSCAALLCVLAAPLFSAAGQETIRPFSTVGVGVKISTLGPGIEVATPLTEHLNLSGGFNMFRYDRNFSSNGVSYAAELRLRSAELHLDYFPFKHGGFHISPGALIYNGDQATANASIPGGDTFTLNHVDFMSDPASPVTGTPKLDFVKAAPMILAGFGNLIPRTKHWSVPFAVGVVFQGTPKIGLNLSGNVCAPDGTNCRSIASDASVQANIQAQQDRYKSDFNVAKYYPIISIGIGYKF
ncbi:MAG TPA: hypothetical protein VGS27_24005 [Candidatus Sulfotelmatobacter sp.]|nr:hypothetical protein [Candidatus Sulfotelmatobacter sp.]